jgi:glycosyltransferase involved in cell wall biosynthesis
MLVVSQYELERLYRERYLPCSFKAQVLHNGIPMQTLQQQAAQQDRDLLRAELGIPEGARVISFMCRLRADKNPEGFLRIARQVIDNPQRKNPVFFLVAGDGKKAALLADSFKPGGLLAGMGAYIGFRDDIPALLKASDITMSTALHEGFGLRVLESMLFGCPSIAYAVGGIPEVYGFGNAPHLSTFEQGKNWLIPKGNESQFVETLVDMVNWSDEAFLALAPQLEAHALQFNLDNHMEQLLSFYQQTFSRLGFPKNSKNAFPVLPVSPLRQLSSLSS